MTQIKITFANGATEIVEGPTVLEASKLRVYTKHRATRIDVIKSDAKKKADEPSFFF